MGNSVVGAGSGCLLEREEELARFDQLFERAREGSGQLLVVSGPAGIGKTRLMEAASSAAADLGFYVGRAVAGELEWDLAWGLSAGCVERRLNPARGAAVVPLSAGMTLAVVAGLARF